MNNYYEDSETDAPALVVVAIDASHSTWLALDEVKQGVRALFNSLAANPQTEVCTVCLRDDSVTVMEDFTPVRESRMPVLVQDIRPKGHTQLGMLLDAAMSELEDRLSCHPHNNWTVTAPELILVSDGDSTDDYSMALGEITHRVSEGRLRVRAISVGKPNLAVLRAIAGTNIMLAANLSEIPGTMGRVADAIVIQRENDTANYLSRLAGSSHDISDRYCVLDFSNLASWGCPKGVARISTPLAIARELKKRHVKYNAWIDASFMPFLKRIDPRGFAYLTTLLETRPDCFQVAPAGGPADPTILDDAGSVPNGCVITRDLYRDWLRDFPRDYGWFREPGRRITGARANGFIFLDPIRWRIRVDEGSEGVGQSNQYMNNH